MSPESRRKQILELINERGMISLSELERVFPDVSTMTLRRDLQYLDDRGEIIRVRRGARAIEQRALSGAVEPSYIMRASHNLPIKDALARAAIALIETERSIFLDAGSTIMRVAHYLPDQAFSLVTHAPNIAQELVKRQNPEVFLLGGTLHRENLAITGKQALAMLDQFNIDTAILGTAGYARGVGFSCGNQGESEIKRQVIRKARRRILLMDQDKLDRTLPITFASIGDIDDLIIDGPLSSPAALALQEDLQGSGVNIIVAPVARERSPS